MKQSWKRSWGGEREEVREKSIHLLVCLLFLCLRNGRRVKSEGVQTRLPVGTSLMVGGLLGSPADGVGLHTSFS